MGSQGMRRTRKLCRAQQSSITRSRTPSFHRRIRSFTMRQRLTLPFTCSTTPRPPLPQADPIFHKATALDTAIHVLDAQPPLVERLVRPLLLQRELLAAGFLRRREDRHLRERER